MITARLQDTRLTYKNKLLSNVPGTNNWSLKLKTVYISTTILFILPPKKKKKEKGKKEKKDKIDLGTNLIKYIQDLYEANYKTLIKEIKKLNKWILISCSLVGRLNNVFNYSKFDHRFSTILNQNPSHLFYGYRQADSKVSLEGHKT